MKLNEDKCHLMICGAKRDTEITVKIGEACIKESREQTYILLHGHWKIKAVIESVRFISI